MVNRCCWLDFSKGIAILLVIIGHALQYYLYPSTFSEEISWRIIYSFHMPFFFILSGAAFSFSKKKCLSSFFIMSRIRRLMIPFVSWALVNLSIMTIVNEKVSMYSYVINPAHGGLWYLWALFYISIFVSLTYVFTRISYQLIASLLFYVALIVLSNTASGKFGLNEISRYFIFFCLGYYARSLGWINYFVSSKKKCSLLLFAAVLIWCVAFFAFVPNSENNFVNWIYKSSIALSGSTVALLLCILMTSIKIPFKKFVEMFGTNTLGMYA